MVSISHDAAEPYLTGRRMFHLPPFLLSFDVERAVTFFDAGRVARFGVENACEEGDL